MPRRRRRWNDATDRLNDWLTSDEDTATHFLESAKRELAAARALDGEDPVEQATRRVAAEIRVLVEATYLSADFIEVARAFVLGVA